MADKMLRVATRGEDGAAKPLKSDNSGNLKIGLSGANSKIFVTHGAVAARTAGNHDSIVLTTTELKDYNNFFIEISNGLDVDITIRVKRGGTWFYEILPVSKNRPAIFTPKDYPCLYLPGGNREIAIRVTTNGTPTTGTVSTWVHATP